MKNLTTMTSCILAIAVTALADESKMIKYQNPRGSELELVWHAADAKSGTLTGTFTTAVSKCKAAIGKPMPITGVYNGNVLALTVNYPVCESVLAFSGNTDKDHEVVNLHWFLTRNSGNSGESWDSTATGVDTFKRMSIKK